MFNSFYNVSEFLVDFNNQVGNFLYRPICMYYMNDDHDSKIFYIMKLLLVYDIHSI